MSKTFLAVLSLITLIAMGVCANLIVESEISDRDIKKTLISLIVVLTGFLTIMIHVYEKGF